MLQAGSIKASIIIPCYNHGQYIKEALDSALRSDFDSYEVIVVDDGSTDEATISVIEELKNQLRDRQNVTFIRQENQGLAWARNNGIRAAKGEYILPLDADNKIRPNYLRKAADILDRNPGIGVVYAYAKFFGEKDGFWEFPAFDSRRLLLHNFIEACSVLRRSVWEDCNGYDPDMGIMGYEDWDLWIGAMEKGWKFHLVKEVLFDYRVVNGSMVAGCSVPENRRHLVKYICDKHRDTYIKNLRYVVAEKDVSILELTQHASNLQAHARNLEEALCHRDTHIENLEKVVRHRDARVSDLETHAGNLEEVVRHRDARVSDLETHASNLEEVVRHRDACINDLESHRKNLETHARNLEEVLRHREARINDLESHRSNVEAHVRNLEAHASNLEEVVRHREARINDLEKHNSNLEAHAENLQGYARNLEAHAKSLEEALQNKSAQISNIQESIRQSDETLHAIYASHGWKLLSLYYRMRDRLLPTGTKRRALAQHFLSVLKTRGE